MEDYGPNRICRLLISRLVKNEIIKFYARDSIGIKYIFTYIENVFVYVITDGPNVISKTNETLKTVGDKINEIKNIIGVFSIYKIYKNTSNIYKEYENGDSFYGCNPEQIKIKHQLLLEIYRIRVSFEILNGICLKIKKIFKKYLKNKETTVSYFDKLQKTQEKQDSFNEIMVKLLQNGNSFGDGEAIPKVEELINNPSNQDLRKIIRTDLQQEYLNLEQEISEIASKLGITNMDLLLKEKEFSKIRVSLTEYKKNIKTKLKQNTKKSNELSTDEDVLSNALKMSKILNKESNDIASNQPVINKNFSFGVSKNITNINLDISYLLK